MEYGRCEDVAKAHRMATESNNARMVQDISFLQLIDLANFLRGNYKKN